MVGNSILLAKILGPLFIAVAIGVLLNIRYYQTVMEDFSQEPVLIYLGGVAAFIFGIIIVIFHNIWVMNGRVIITVMGWMSLVKGVCLIVFPKSLSFFGKLVKKTGFLVIYLTVALIVGVLLTIMGYFLV